MVVLLVLPLGPGVKHYFSYSNVGRLVGFRFHNIQKHPITSQIRYQKYWIAPEHLDHLVSYTFLMKYGLTQVEKFLSAGHWWMLFSFDWAIQGAVDSLNLQSWCRSRKSCCLSELIEANRVLLKEKLNLRQL